MNARACRTVPFASKATGVPLARIATQLIMGERLSELRITNYVLQFDQAGNSSWTSPSFQNRNSDQGRVSVKAVVLPFNKFPTLDPVLGPEMQSTGESMAWPELR